MQFRPNGEQRLVLGIYAGNAGAQLVVPLEHNDHIGPAG
jgi:hypothetical protein